MCFITLLIQLKLMQSKISSPALHCLKKLIGRKFNEKTSYNTNEKVCCNFMYLNLIVCTADAVGSTGICSRRRESEYAQRNMGDEDGPVRHRLEISQQIFGKYDHKYELCLEILG